MFAFIAVVGGDITHKATMNILKHKLQWTFEVYPYVNLLSNDFYRLFLGIIYSEKSSQKVSCQ